MADKKTPQGEKGLIMLEVGHPVITDALTELLAEDAKREAADIKISDFDSVEYQVLVTPENKDEVCLSMKMKCAAATLPMGTKMALDAAFPGIMQNSALPGYDITLKFDATKLKPEDKPKLIKMASELRYMVMGTPLERCFDALSKDQSGNLKPMILEYRSKEAMYIHPLADRVMVFYSVDFEDDTDRAIANIFLNEFAEAQRRMQQAPAVTFTKDAPGQLKSVPGFKESPNCLGYLMFTITKMHVGGDKTRNTAQLLVGLRSYVHYHVTAAKTQLQTRMRSRVEALLKSLARAVPELLEAEKASGRRNTNVANPLGMKTFRRF